MCKPEGVARPEACGLMVCIFVSKWKGGRKDGWMRYTYEWKNGYKWIYEWMGGWVDGWMNGWMDIQRVSAYGAIVILPTTRYSLLSSASCPGHPLRRYRCPSPSCRSVPRRYSYRRYIQYVPTNAPLLMHPPAQLYTPHALPATQPSHRSQKRSGKADRTKRGVFCRPSTLHISVLCRPLGTPSPSSSNAQGAVGELWSILHEMHGGNLE